METRPLPELSVTVLIACCLLPLAHEARAQTWAREHIGAVVAAIPAPNSSVVVGSLKGVVARLSTRDGSEIWKLGSVQGDEQAVGLVHANEDRVVLVRVHCARNGFRIRAVDIDSGELLWERPARDAALVPRCYVEIVSPSQRPGSGATVLVHVRTAELLEDDLGVCRVGVAEDRIPLLPDKAEGNWNFDGLLLSSEKNGDFMLREHDKGSPLWRRREALAHGTAAGFYLGDRVRNESTRVLVVLTHFRLIFGLSCVDGSVLWTCDLAHVLVRHGLTDSNADLRLIDGHDRNAVVLARSGTDTACIVVRAKDGHLGRVRVHRAYLASQAVVIAAGSKPSENEAQVRDTITCVIMINSDGAERADDAGCSNETRTWLLGGVGGDSVTAYTSGKILWNIKLPFGERVATMALAPSAKPFRRVARRSGSRRFRQDRAFYPSTDASAAALVLSMEDGLESDAFGVTAYLISSRTGAIFYERRHLNASGHFSALACENWFVYAFWNPGTLEQEVHVLETVESWSRHRAYGMDRLRFISKLVREVLPRKFSSVVIRTFAALSQRIELITPSIDGSHDSRVQLSGHPIVLQSSWLSTHRIAALGVSATERGHTERQVVFGFSSGRIAHLSRFKLTKQLDKIVFERSTSKTHLTEFGALLFWPSQAGGAYLFGGREVPELLSKGGIVTAPFWRRESSSQLACIGTDILYTVVAAAGFFDILPDDFNRSGVIFSIGVLLICATVSRYRAKNILLQSMWASAI